MEQTRHHYGLFTTVTMIIGICIGSGIFFKSDNILAATGGSVPLGVLVFVLGATSIIFGGLCISELASRTDRPGGVITYVEEFASEKLACGMGWFQIFVYLPTIAAVVSWVVGIYICLLFGWEGTLENQMLIGFLFYTLNFMMNSLSARLGGGFQNFSTISKMLPLAVIAVCGLFFGNPAKGFQSIAPSTLGGAAWLSAIGPIAYSFDGWSISTSIAPEIRDSKKNLPRALIIAPVIILITYVAYFVGVSSLLDPQKIVALQDAHVYTVAKNLFGGFGAQLVLIFVIIAVMGTANGIILGYIRLPYSMALRGEGMFPLSDKLSKLDEKHGMPVNSAIFCYVITTFWAAIHFITVKFGLLPNSDVSEIAIVMSYIFYIILYYKVFALYRAGEIKSAFRGVAVPILATLGSLFILSGGLQSKLFFLYAAFCILVVLAALLYYRRHHLSVSQN
ncbi:MAG: APC family permease [Ruminococcaceae bacterium]|nr:APC family permease [Oscillospiraceae bacterium]